MSYSTVGEGEGERGEREGGRREREGEGGEIEFSYSV